MDEVVEKNATMFVRASFLVVFFGCLTQVSGAVPFPSYNVALGFFGAYSSLTKNGKATFAFIAFCSLTILLDIIFCSINGNNSDGFRFSLSMLIFCLFAKVYALYTSSHFFASIGGASTLDDNMSSSAYEALAGSVETLGGRDTAGGLKTTSAGGYFPPPPNSMGSINKSENQGMQPLQQQIRKPINTFTGMTDSGSF